MCCWIAKPAAAPSARSTFQKCLSTRSHSVGLGSGEREARSWSGTTICCLALPPTLVSVDTSSDNSLICRFRRSNSVSSVNAPRGMAGSEVSGFEPGAPASAESESLSPTRRSVLAHATRRPASFTPQPTAHLAMVVPPAATSFMRCWGVMSATLTCAASSRSTQSDSDPSSSQRFSFPGLLSWPSTSRHSGGRWPTTSTARR